MSGDNNLGDISTAVDRVLPAYETLLGITFGDHAPLTLQPEKPYTARTDIPVFLDGSKAGALYAIMFTLHDATGNKNTDLIVPQEIAAEHVLPRDKTGTHIEALLPILSVQNNKRIPYLASLDELTVDDVANPQKIIKAWDLGLSQDAYHAAVLDRITPTSPWDHVTEKKIMHEPTIYLTVGYKQDGQRFGDPHSIYCSTPDVAQVVGFLAAAEGSPLRQILEKHGKIPE
ncbi:hypothetical protein KY346_01360 [Candidatus Woesearchaeota archaeon]|nr:hypothetical protein [Candidatus Woesearchaeota archaeon]